ncbi:MAG: LPXTG cell wall anchor domain-containing protein [Lachnospiraceae bacterium]|nr:LPXTG cell wall anchor domain-containing protein [Lachnospiraceae bacterium]
MQSKTYISKNSDKPTEPKLPQTGDNMNPWIYVGIGLAAIIAGAMVFRKKKK